MILGKLWLRSSDTPVEPSKISEFVKDTRVVIVSQPKIEPVDFVGTFDKNPFDINFEKSFDFNLSRLGNVESISDQDIPIWPPSELTDSRLKQNHVEFQQSYMEILNEVKHEAEQAALLDNSIDKIKDKAYGDSAVVMKEIYNAGVSSPEVDWNEDGSINLSWFLKTGGTSTIMLYGDDYVIYNAYLEPDHYVRSVCKIRGGLVLPNLINILLDITK